MTFDIAAIGAGLAGLTSAAQLQQAGYNVVVVEKSRGLGGRVATRRIPNHRADFGARYLEANGRLVSLLLEILRDRQIVQLWTEASHRWDGNLIPDPPRPHYVPPNGMNEIGKFLGRGTRVWFSRRACQLTPQADNTWHLSLEAVADGSDAPLELTAKAVILAVPAPQALEILADTPGLPEEFRNNLAEVEYNPCITAIAKYPNDRPLPDWVSVNFPPETDLSWVGLDSSKRPNTQQPVFVVHSSADFARSHLNTTNLEAPGRELLDRASNYLLPWLSEPEFLQVHRWRYAFTSQPWRRDCLAATTPLPLVCCGDWCGTRQIETALRSGLAAASITNSQLQQEVLSPIRQVWQSL
ncbi:NAD(P)/FAD-dependent oxidoreductase [Baaleninema simplex]|uniref:NAD(P)/FAD-dependent oxidoreductase n=1 Tax=Baaleninema simplex TaxID=2862350 RepID=UPI000348BD31|nr:FAD-dependent oxidoreductase [Baaleninema simplex]